jgi:hypothetical protein
MSNGPILPASRQVKIALCLLLACVAVAVVFAATARASVYRMVMCAGGTSSDGPAIATNTASPSNPGGIFTFQDNCQGAGSDPAGESGWLRIYEHENAGNAGEGAYGSMSWTETPWVNILGAGGFTREPNAFNDGWRGRFWLEDWGGGTNNTLMQGAGVANGSLGGVGWGTTPSFGSHLWPFGGFGSYRRFVFELTCLRPAGCDRSNFNAVDANTFVLTLDDTFPVDLHLTNTSPLMGGQWVKGNQTATYMWSDQGSGIRMEWINIDAGRAFTIDHWNECNTGSSGADGEFARVFQPCATASNIGRAYGFNTASLPDGAHTLQACAQDYGQWQGLYGTGGASCEQTTIRTDNAAPGAPAGLEATSANAARYLPEFGVHWQLPPNSGSPIQAIHYDIINAADEVVVPEKTVSGTDLSALAKVEGPAKAGDYRIKVWLEDGVGFTGPATTAPIPHDTTPPAAPQDISVTPPTTSKAADGFDLRWHNIVDSGSPIDSARYQVLDGAGKVVIPTATVSGDNPQAIADLDAPSAAGTYQLRLWLTDAEGNVGAPVTAPLTYDCMRSPTPGGQQLTATLGGQPSQTVQQGQDAALSGTLDGQGGPVATAPVCVYSRVATDQSREFLGIALTDQSGGYHFPIPAGPSREVSAIYRPGQRQLRAAATLQTVVHPTLRTPSSVVKNKSIAHFEGDIPGPHNDQVVIVLQVKSGKGWLAFRRYRTRDDGHYDLEYKFRRTTRPTSYEMRAQVRETTGYPYEQGDSDPLTLRVVPARARPAAKKPAKAKRRCAKGSRAVKRRGKARCVKAKHRAGSHKATSSSRPGA